MNAATLRARARYWWRKEIRWWLVIGLVVFSLRSSLADWSDVPTGSMKPTILEGDRVYVNKLAYDLKVPFTTRHLAEWSNPHRGDIVVFFSPHDGQRLVKRVVGVPGDTIELRNDGLVLNGQAVEYKPIAEEVLRDIAPADRARQVYAVEQLPGQRHAVAAIPSVPALRNFGPYRGAGRALLHDGGQPRQQLRLPLLRPGGAEANRGAGDRGGCLSTGRTTGSRAGSASSPRWTAEPAFGVFGGFFLLLAAFGFGGLLGGLEDVFRGQDNRGHAVAVISRPAALAPMARMTNTPTTLPSRAKAGEPSVVAVMCCRGCRRSGVSG